MSIKSRICRELQNYLQKTLKAKLKKKNLPQNREPEGGKNLERPKYRWHERLTGNMMKITVLETTKLR